MKLITMVDNYPLFLYSIIGPSFKSVDSPFRPVVKVVALIAA